MVTANCTDYSDPQVVADCESLSATGLGMGNMLSNLGPGVVSLLKSLAFLGIVIGVIAGITIGLTAAFKAVFKRSVNA